MKSFSLVMILVIGLLSFGTVLAQDTTPEPTPQGELSLGDLVGNKAQYYRQEVTTEGSIEELVNVRAFVLGDHAALNDHQLLVINASDQEFDLGVKKDQAVRLTGTLYPDFNSGGWLELVGASSVNGPSPTEPVTGTESPMTEVLQSPATVIPQMMATAEMTPSVMGTAEMTPSMMNTPEAGSAADLSQMFIPDNLRGFTILVLNELHITYLNNS